MQKRGTRRNKGRKRNKCSSRAREGQNKNRSNKGPSEVSWPNGGKKTKRKRLINQKRGEGDASYEKGGW